ncbi:hypothetical protein JR065_05620 [Xanthomonas sp. AmX2]|uniref:hypothetical protein n=1 Tax=Xanthomonas sp. TaxID=29446 RepID=UPI0019821C60|nr:hypothetical protein [Xanthomonas sp.]MBN6149809.1 hypothetical protein [Xanthomonas sp.]
MRMPNRKAGWVALAALAAAMPLHAQDSTEARLRDALRDTSARLRQAEAALVQQQLATAAAERERDALRAAPAPRAAAADPAREAALQRQLEQARRERDEARAQQRQQQDAQRQAAQAAVQREQAQAALNAELQRNRTQMAQCAAGGEALYATARELAALYRDPAFVRFVRSHGRELFGMARVTRENRVRALEDRLAEQHAQNQACATATAAAQGAAP